jgi:hypothetical protein
MPLLRTVMIVLLPAYCSITHSGGGIARKSHVMSRPRLNSRLLVRHGIHWT